jgi:hypothetical protein
MFARSLKIGSVYWQQFQRFEKSALLLVWICGTLL